MPPWIGDRLEWLSAEHAARVSLTGPQSADFEGVDPARMGRDILPYVAETPKIVNAQTTNWTAGPYPNLGWAQRVHPELEPEQALDKLWDEIVHILRLDADDPAAAWHERMRAIVASADRITERRFDAIHLHGPGTDLTIGLLPELEVARRRLPDHRGAHPLPQPADRGDLHHARPGSGRRPRVRDDAARALRLVSWKASASSSRAGVP